jgi:hypothetical protein
MRKFLASALAALTFGGAVLATAAPAQAEHNSYYRRHKDGGDDAAIAVIAGIAGLAIGAAIANKNDDRDRYDRGYGYRDSYGYRNNYGTGYGYSPQSDRYYRHHRHGYDGYYDRSRTCVTRERVWDSYRDRYVRVERRYPC